jgi:hypothetical protein
VEHFKRRAQLNAPKTKVIRSDGTYPPLDTVLTQSLARVLLQWRARTYSRIRKETYSGGESVFLLPERLLQRVVDRAHACTTLDRLWGIMHDWEHLPLFGEDLFNLLTQVLPGYAAILKARQELSDCMDVDPPLTETGGPTADSSNMDVDSRLPLRVRLFVPPRQVVPSSPAKASTRCPSPPSPLADASHKRTKTANKENIFPA